MEVNVSSFFSGFNFDTLLALISCIASVIALFLGGSAYKKCKLLQSSLNDTRNFSDNSQDHSQRAAHDIINNNTCDTSALVALTTANFEASLSKACDTLEQQNKTNIRQILLRTKKMIEDGKINISQMTKIDWINVYMESAKNASDTYMQNVWSKILLKEMETPGSFSFKTLDVLKNMAREEFELFTLLANTTIDTTLFRGNHLKDVGFNWVTLQKLKDFGLINLEDSETTYRIESHNSFLKLMPPSYCVAVNNEGESPKELKLSCYLLTHPAQELMKILDTKIEYNTAIAIASVIKEKAEKGGLSVSLHRVNYIRDDGVSFNYAPDDIL